MSLKELILNAEDLPREPISIPEWPGTDGMLFVRVMTGTERDAYEASWLEKKGEAFEVNRANLRAKLAVRTLVDSAGVRIFEDAETDSLGKKSSAALDRIFEVASRLNRISKKDEDELLKNSEPAPNDSSGTGSQVT